MLSLNIGLLTKIRTLALTLVVSSHCVGCATVSRGMDGEAVDLPELAADASHPAIYLRIFAYSKTGDRLEEQDVALAKQVAARFRERAAQDQLFSRLTTDPFHQDSVDYQVRVNLHRGGRSPNFAEAMVAGMSYFLVPMVSSNKIEVGLRVADRQGDVIHQYDGNKEDWSVFGLAALPAATTKPRTQSKSVKDEADFLALTILRQLMYAGIFAPENAEQQLADTQEAIP